MAGDEDGEVLELVPPLPGLAKAIRVEYRRGGGGLRRKGDPATRATAEFALVHTTGPTGKADEERLDLDAVDALLAEVEQLRAKIEARRGEQATERAETDAHMARRAEVAAAFSSPCARCGVEREHAGPLHLAVGDPDRQRTSTGTGWVSQVTTTFEEYRCPVCGSVELFRRGALDHPAR